MRFQKLGSLEWVYNTRFEDPLEPTDAVLYLKFQKFGSYGRSLLSSKTALNIEKAHVSKTKKQGRERGKLAEEEEEDIKYRDPRKTTAEGNNGIRLFSVHPSRKQKGHLKAECNEKDERSKITQTKSNNQPQRTLWL